MASNTAESITHTGATGEDLTVTSTSGNTKIESVTFAGNDVSTLNDLTMTGGISMSSNTAESITHTGASNQHLTVTSTSGNTNIESVTFAGTAITTTGAITTGTLSSGQVTTSVGISMSSTSAQSITHAGNNNQDLTVTSTSGDTKIESVTFDGTAITTTGAITTGTLFSGQITTSAGISMSSTSAQSITHAGNSGQHLTVTSTSGNTKIESVTFAGNDVSNVDDLTMTGGISMTSTGNEGITHTGRANDRHLTVKSTQGNTKIESVTFSADDISDVSDISMSGNLAINSRERGIRVSSLDSDTEQASTNYHNNNCEVSYDIGNRKIGLIQLPVRYNNNNNNCRYHANQARTYTVSHSMGTSNFLVFLTVQKHPTVHDDNNFMSLGIKSRSTSNFVLYIGNPTNSNHDPGSGNNYETAYVIIRRT